MFFLLDQMLCLKVRQQSSCFRLHLHNAPPGSNPTLITTKVDRGSKKEIREELHSVNINQIHHLLRP